MVEMLYTNMSFQYVYEAPIGINVICSNTFPYTVSIPTNEYHQFDKMERFRLGLVTTNLCIKGIKTSRLALEVTLICFYQSTCMTHELILYSSA